ncbi:hypothetical protein EB796_007063 [Bugula neritina]|uniref:Uncharacterized protein n=1 Tax=Bugula neritina TaxID=10212 RepID=A0A7J7K8R4_BUGNE|nr:hypothetical protein EB796_007063 [Bugula neritina]
MAFPSRHKTLYKSALSIHTERTDERFQTAHHRIVTADQEERVKWAHHEPSVSAGERVVATRHGQVYLHNVSIYLPPIVRLAWPTLLFAVNPEYDTAVHKDPTPWHVTTATFVPSPVHSGQQMSSNYTAVHYAATHVELIMEEHTHASLDVNNFVEQLESEVFESLPYSLAEHQTHMLGVQSYVFQYC